MFYPHLLNISKSDLVLEVGPGAYPYWRSDCLVDKFENSPATDISQFGGAPQQTMGKPLFLINDAQIPFGDRSFDYLICAQVLEHVPSQELALLVSEMMRVAKRVYIEIPRPVFDLVYDFDVHLNLMDIVAGTIVCLPKEKTNLNKVKLITQYALELRESQGFAVERNSFNAVAVRVEFSGHIPLIICNSEVEFFERISKNIVNIPPPTLHWKIKERLACFVYKHARKHHSKSEFAKLMINPHLNT
jgi:Methyltransferase domain